MKPAAQADFSTVTEQPGQRATREQLSMLVTRYNWAAGKVPGKHVLEVACGAGMGLGLLARAANSVEAGDLDPVNWRMAQDTYRGRENVHISRIDALALPYEPERFDCVVLFEALYYLPDAARFFREARRVLRPAGELLVSTVNREWPRFNPSPFSTNYFSAAELQSALESAGFAVRVWAGFPDDPAGVRRRMIGLVRRAAVKLDLVPRTMRGKESLKRLFYGKLQEIPRELTRDTAPIARMVPAQGDLGRFRTIYAEARKNS
jgi:SAM-dependent methyltransferase